MCYNLSQVETNARKMEKRFADSGAFKPDGNTIQKVPSYYFVSGFEHPDLVVLTKTGFEVMSWGLLPFGASDVKIRNSTLNARSEEIFETRSYKGSIHQHRCILPVTGFVEFREVNKKKYPYLIHQEGDIFGLGCIYAQATDPISRKIIRTFSIVTTEANPIMEVIHNNARRMPLVIPYDFEAAWINPMISETDIKELMQPFYGNLKAYSISTDANNSRNDRNKYDILHEVKYDIPPVYYTLPGSDNVILY